MKMQKRKEQRYKMHLKCAAKWHKYWHIIQTTIDSKQQIKMETHYNNLNKKLDKLQNKQRGKTNMEHDHHEQHEQQCYPLNRTNIKFTKQEMALLNQVPRHSREKPLNILD
jgi:hypothetical protein